MWTTLSLWFSVVLLSGLPFNSKVCSMQPQMYCGIICLLAKRIVIVRFSSHGARQNVTVFIITVLPASPQWLSLSTFVYLSIDIYCKWRKMAGRLTFMNSGEGRTWKRLWPALKYRFSDDWKVTENYVWMWDFNHYLNRKTKTWNRNGNTGTKRR